jgi:hypothetical protein
LDDQLAVAVSRLLTAFDAVFARIDEMPYLPDEVVDDVPTEIK